MRTAVSGSVLLVSIGILILIHSSIISKNVRECEVENALSSSIEYAVDVMSDTYKNLKFNGDEEEQKNNLIKIFVDSINNRIATDGNITVKVLCFDFEEGYFHVVVTENYNYPKGKGNGSVSCEKAYKLKTSESLKTSSPITLV